MARPAHWSGTVDESFALVVAVSHHCTCNLAAPPSQRVTCPAHQLLQDQRALNGLLVYRHLADQLRREEGCLPA